MKYQLLECVLKIYFTCNGFKLMGFQCFFIGFNVLILKKTF